MVSHDRNKEVTEIWNMLCRDPEAFLRDRDPLEDEFVEFKGAVFREPLYDEINAINGKPFQRSEKILHDNLFRAIEAIAGMANTGGGIVIFGVVSAMEDSFLDDGTPLPEMGMKGKGLVKKYKRREQGIRVGNALVIGLDKEIPEKKKSGPTDAPLDKYIQRIFGSESILWGKHGHEGKTLHDFNDWLEFVPKDAEDEQSYPTVDTILWRRSKWSEALGPHLFAGGRLLEVKDDKGNSRWIAGLKIRTSDTPIYYVNIPFPKKGKKHLELLTDEASLEWPVCVPFRFPAQVKCYYLQDRAALQTLIERFGKGMPVADKIALIPESAITGSRIETLALLHKSSLQSPAKTKCHIEVQPCIVARRINRDMAFSDASLNNDYRLNSKISIGYYYTAIQGPVEMTIFDVGTTGKLTVLMPNDYLSEGRINWFPDAHSNQSIILTGLTGVETVFAIATEKALDLRGRLQLARKKTAQEFTGRAAVMVVKELLNIISCFKENGWAIGEFEFEIRG